MVDGVELVRPDLAVLRLSPGEPAPALPLRVVVPGAGRQTVQVREVVEADGDASVVALVLAEPIAMTAVGSMAGATMDAKSNWLCKLFPRFCR